MSKGRILIVERDAIVAWDLEESLETAGYEVCCVADAAAAMREAGAFQPELAILDADVAGPLEAEALHAQHGAAVVFLTAHPIWWHSAWLAAALPLVFLEKPFHPAELMSAIAEAIAPHRAGEPSFAPPKPPRSRRCSPARVAVLALLNA